MSIFCCCGSEERRERTSLLKPERLSPVTAQTDTRGRQAISTLTSKPSGTRREAIAAKLGPQLNANYTVQSPRENKEESDEAADSASQVLFLKGKIIEDGGHYEEALAIYLQALKIRIDRFGEFGEKNLRSLQYEIICYKGIHEALLKLRRIPEAFPYLERLLKAHIIFYGSENHQEVGLTVNGIGMMYHIMGQNEKALEYFLRGARIQDVLYGKEHGRIADNFKYTGICLAKLERFQEAWVYLLKSLFMAKKFVKDDSELMKDIAKNIFKLALKCAEDKKKCRELLEYFQGDDYEDDAFAVKFCQIMIPLFDAAGDEEEVAFFKVQFRLMTDSDISK